MSERPEPLDPQELHDEDFQFALKELLRAYQPILEEELKRAAAPDQLKKDAERPPSCDDEIALAERLFGNWVTQEVAVRLLPAQARDLLGPINRWRWCLFHIRCCLIFGWLVCRRPLTFRAFAYYLHRFWFCVRQVLGVAPVNRPLTTEERQDFQTLVRLLAGAYRPYLAHQLSDVEVPAGIPDEILEGKIDCSEGEGALEAVFERLMTTEAAAALLGKEHFATHSKQPWFWFCRCWCVCAFRFGCCLARARSFVDVVRCLAFYWRCLRECFRPLTCELTNPHDCAEEGTILPKGIPYGVEIRGTAAGMFCSHYTLEWREAGTSTWQSSGIHYPGTPQPPVGTCGVVNGTLGWLETFPSVPTGPVEIRLCVYSTQPGVSPHCCTIAFTLQRNLVWIRGIEGISAATPPGVLDPTAQLLDAASEVRSFGTALRIFGTVWVGGCEGRRIRRYTLSHHPGFVVDPTLPGFVPFWQVDYISPLQIAASSVPILEDEVTRTWRELQICFPMPIGCVTIANYLEETAWSTQVPVGYPVIPPSPPNPAWTSTPLPFVNCQSGKFTLRLSVERDDGVVLHDTQQAWFDNKTDGINASRIVQIAGVPPCDTINLSMFSAPGADCAVPWPASLLGVAYDEYIEEGNAAIPSDNFEGYQLWIRKDGGPWFSLPIPGPGAPPWGPPFVGASRVGDPHVRCATASPPPGPFPPPTPGVVPPATLGILAVLDLRRLDAVCNPAEPALTLHRGECCGYVVWLQVRDKTICPSLPGGRHIKNDFFPFCICNDLPRP